MRTEQTILSNLVYNEEYTRKILAFVKDDYFHDVGDRVVFKLITDYLDKYNACPSKEALLVEVDAASLTEGVYKSAVATIENLQSTKSDMQWLLDTTEKFCQDKSIHNAIHTAIKILDKSEEVKNLDKGMIPKLLSDALGVSFDTNIGHDFLEDHEARFDFYNNVEEKIPFDLDYLNRITKGGLSKKSLNIILAGCVHPSTMVKIKYTKDGGSIEKDVPIILIKMLLQQDIDVQIWSPDGWVYVEKFVDKGEWQEYVLSTENGKNVQCNENHLFKTTMGWMSAKEMYELQETYGTKIHVETEFGLSLSVVERSNNMIPIVDINVAHENSRYYTNGVESHNTGVGKSLFMCHMAAANLMDNKNVLYITMEMAEEKIAERIDANLLNIKMDDLSKAPKESYNKMIGKLKSRTMGKLIIKEYPTASANAAHFRHLLNELRQKKNFVPDIIYIDYLNICASSRIKPGGGVNSYTYIKSIAEELRGLAVEFKVPIVSATQTTRSGYGDSDVGITDTSESFGLPATADFMVAVITNEELESLGQFMVKQLKNRYNDPALYRRFIIGVDKSRMKLYDAEDSAQTLMDDSPPTFDQTPSGSRMSGDLQNKMKDFK